MSPVSLAQSQDHCYEVVIVMGALQARRGSSRLPKYRCGVVQHMMQGRRIKLSSRAGVCIASRL